MKKPAIAIAVFAGVALLVATRAHAQAVQVVEVSDYSPDYTGTDDVIASGFDWSSILAELPTVAGVQIMQESEPQLNQVETTYEVQSMDANKRAFLEAVSMAEGTAREPDPYRVCFGYKHTINSLADHPAITGEWRGEKLSDAHCTGAGLSPGCVSTAAGKYQIIKPTWQRLKSRLRLADFSAASQDAACVELIREAGALEYVERGEFAQAVQLVRKVWASLPGAGYGQGERSMQYLQAAFIQAGGRLA